ncbi:MAG: S8 family serine peptidase [bacterium]|nr:S8 family serine peptidase [bacterium]
MKVFQLLLITFLFKVGAYAENPEKPKPEDGKIVVGNSFTEIDHHVTDGIIVDFKNTVTKQQIKNFETKFAVDYQQYSLYPEEKIGLIRLAKGLTNLINRLRTSPLVEAVEPNYIYSLVGEAALRKNISKPKDPNPEDFQDPYYKHQWHMAQINLPQAFARVQGHGAIVAVIDTGVAYEDYQGFKRVRDLNETQFIHPYDFVDNDAHANDDHGHGTHVAGTIAQSTNNGLGVVGVAPGATIMPLRVLDGSGRGSLGAIANAIKWAADKGAHVINMSLGGPFPSSILRKACKYAADKGVLLVCAAGNSGGRIGYPAKYPECMAVSAVQYDESITFYSSRGKEVSIAAPGGNVRVDQNGDGYPDGVLQNSIYAKDNSKDDYMLFMGTSMAAPHVAGAAALLVSAGVTDAKRIEQILKSSARYKGDEQLYGAGLLDVGNAVNQAVSGTAWSRLLAAFLIAFAFLKSNITRLLHPLSLLGLIAFGSGVVPLGFNCHVDQFPGFLCYPIPVWDQAFLGLDVANPIFRSAFWVLLFVGFGYQIKILRPFLQGMGFGLSGFLLVSAFMPQVDLDYIPIALQAEFIWYILNALLAAMIAKHANPK